jgi:uncharacterized protein YkwD
MHDRTATPLPRPKSMMRALAAGGLMAATLGHAAPADARGGQNRLDSTERKVISLINGQRAARGLPPLTRSRRLARSADYHSWDMLRGNFFAHASSSGASFQGRVRRYSQAARVGENLAYVRNGQGRGQAERIVGMWMASPDHQAVLLSPGFRKIGVARRTGTLGTLRATVFTADLSSRR